MSHGALAPGHRRHAWVDVLVASVPFAVGLALVLHFGRLGYMPLDQSIVFDGAWRLLSGQVPYRDFSTPSGLTPIVLQAPLFALLGTTWFAYCLHAAIVNGLFCVVVYVLLRTLAAPRPLAFVYALASGVLLYPPIGTPYLEQHAFFFLLLTIVLLLGAAETASAARASWLAALAGPAVVLAFFSKQNVVLFGSVPVLVVLALAPRDLRRAARLLLASGAGVLATAAALVALGLALGVARDGAAHALLWLPLETGAMRTVRTDRVLRTLLLVWSPLAAAALAGAAVPLAVLRLAAARGRDAGTREASHRALLAESLALALLATCLLFLATTKNHPANGIPYVFAALGLAHQGLRLLLPGAGRRASEAVLVVALLVVLVLDAWTFNSTVNVPRVVNDLVFRPALAVSPATPELSFLRLQTPARSGVRARQLDRLIDFLRSHDGNFFLLGDSSILYALTGRPSLSPVLWFHPGLTFPAPGSPGFAAWNAALARSLRAGDVRYVVIEGPETWMRLTLEQLPALAELLRERAGGPSARFGPFTVIELRRADTPR